jgi:hypothetical protein
MDHEGVSLWDRDVVEAFINADPQNIRHYGEFEVAPTNERLDLMVNLPGRDFAWSSQFQSLVKVDRSRKLWTCQVRIPLAALGQKKPSTGTRWGLTCSVATARMSLAGVEPTTGVHQRPSLLELRSNNQMKTTKRSLGNWMDYIQGRFNRGEVMGGDGIVPCAREAKAIFMGDGPSPPFARPPAVAVCSPPGGAAGGRPGSGQGLCLAHLKDPTYRQVLERRRNPGRPQP